MSTLRHCNKERERNTHLRLKEASWNIASLLSYLKSGGIAHPPSPTLVAHFGVLATQFGISPHGGGGGGVAWVALSRAFPQTQGHKELVFCLFLLSYMTSGPFSWWYILLLAQRFFWYYFSRQVMAILCCVAQKAASAAQLDCLSFRLNWLPPPLPQASVSPPWNQGGMYICTMYTCQ